MSEYSAFAGAGTLTREAGEDLSSLEAGQVLAGRYEITQHLGSGGFGIVYEARDLQAQGQVVAIKEYFPSASCLRRGGVTVSVRGLRDRAVFDQGLKAFLAEAKLLRELDHPGIVRVYEWFEANGTAYIAMKRLNGRTLQAILDAREPVAEDQVRAWLQTLLHALQTMHAQQVLHRDISPGNIIVTPQGAPVLIDFGAARQCIGRVSQSLQAILCPGYAPLEQYDEHGLEKQDASTDLYALGATFYHLCVGAKPIAATSRVTRDPLRPAAQAAADRYSAPLLAAIDRAMAVAQPDRWDSARSWLAALEVPGAQAGAERKGGDSPASESPGGGARAAKGESSPGKSRSPIPAGLFAIAALVAGGVAVELARVGPLQQRLGEAEALASAHASERDQNAGALETERKRASALEAELRTMRERSQALDERASRLAQRAQRAEEEKAEAEEQRRTAERVAAAERERIEGERRNEARRRDAARGFVNGTPASISANPGPFKNIRMQLTQSNGQLAIDDVSIELEDSNPSGAEPVREKILAGGQLKVYVQASDVARTFDWSKPYVEMCCWTTQKRPLSSTRFVWSRGTQRVASPCRENDIAPKGCTLIVGMAAVGIDSVWVGSIDIASQLARSSP